MRAIVIRLLNWLAQSCRTSLLLLISTLRRLSIYRRNPLDRSELNVKDIICSSSVASHHGFSALEPPLPFSDTDLPLADLDLSERIVSNISYSTNSSDKPISLGSEMADVDTERNFETAAPSTLRNSVLLLTTPKKSNRYTKNIIM